MIIRCIDFENPIILAIYICTAIVLLVTNGISVYATRRDNRENEKKAYEKGYRDGMRANYKNKR